MASDTKEIRVNETYLRTLERRVDDLQTLIEVSTIISSTLDFNKLISLVMDKAKNVMNAEACSILLYNKQTNKLEFAYAISKETATANVLSTPFTLDMGQGVAGWVAQTLQTVIIEDVTTDERFFEETDRFSGFTTKSLIAVALVGRGGLIGVAEILNPRDKHCFCQYDEELFSSLCRQITIAIENAMFYHESLEMEKVRQELEIASVLQKSFLPDTSVFRRGAVEVRAVNIPAEQVGGDIYDFIEPVGGKVGIFVGDVSGKGVSAAMYMAKIISDFRYNARLEDSPDVVLGNLNAALLKGPLGMFVTAVYLIIDVSTGAVNISNGGHPPFLLARDNKITVIDPPGGPPLGIIAAKYPLTSMTLNRGDRLLLITDGVFDTKNRLGQRLGFDALVAALNRTDNAPYAQGLIDYVVDYVNKFAEGTRTRVDDLTLVELRYC
ncbi:MAG: GAF domain-containing SpoIIE family protein phosphatase [Candidatus Magnetobacterium sp. LHC-1]|uniref:SpoIIE family protein phosphatase n=1 Tax=Candidatus Magnetobacterium casense TaxID=1455061 RepID=A0ABS6RXX8_9BACT|nr:GAF domain-containing SpoIIE family protein phosphatase [Candidatus Magnetobacterium casensis]MBV6341489.1 SpoIIE family protein phosphatase [Candidatus Magnetobacterium casensis]